MYAAGAAMLIVGAVLLGLPPLSSGVGAAVVANPGTVGFFAGAAGNIALTGSQPSGTVFNIALPSGAGCSNPGSAGGNYYSFLVPEGTDLSALTYSTDPPQPDQGTALAPAQPTGGYVQNLNAGPAPTNLVSPTYLQGLEMASLVATGRGQDAKTVTGAQLPSGTALIPTGSTSAQYEAGVVCYLANSSGTPTETDYWSAPVVFTTSSTDPAGFTWAPVASSGTGTTTTTVAGETTTTVSGVTTTTVAGETTTTVSGETTTTVSGETTTTVSGETTTTAATTATHLVLTALPTTATTGSSFSFTVDAEDASGAIATSYDDQIAFTSSDPSATLPATSTLTSGAGTFTATFNTAGDQTITATDTTTSSITGTSAAVYVTASSATTSTTLACTATTTTSTTSSTSTTSTSTTSTSTTSTSTTSTTSTTVPCTTTTTTTTAGATTSSADGASGGSATDAPTGGSTALPNTGQATTPELMAGLVLVALGLVMLGAARRRQAIERLAWPDER